MSHAERFEDLRVWQEARMLTRQVHAATRSLRDFGFRDQIRGASLSSTNNLAEGFERGSDAEFARFRDIAKGSAGEMRSMTYVAEDESHFTSLLAEELRFAGGRLAEDAQPLRPIRENPNRCAASRAHPTFDNF